MTDREVMQMALDAMVSFSTGTNGLYEGEFAEEIAALRAALARGEQEPVAVVDANDEGYWADILPDRSVKVGQLLYTAPSQREWQGLTDEEINTIAATPAAIPGSYVHSFARAIEAKLKEKNT